MPLTVVPRLRDPDDEPTRVSAKEDLRRRWPLTIAFLASWECERLARTRLELNEVFRPVKIEFNGVDPRQPKERAWETDRST